MRLFQEVLEILPGEALLMIMVVFLAAVSWGCILGSCVLFLVPFSPSFFLYFLATMMYVSYSAPPCPVCHGRLKSLKL